MDWVCTTYAPSLSVCLPAWGDIARITRSQSVCVRAIARKDRHIRVRITDRPVQHRHTMRDQQSTNKTALPDRLGRIIFNGWDWPATRTVEVKKARVALPDMERFADVTVVFSNMQSRSIPPLKLCASPPASTSNCVASWTRLGIIGYWP
jgi:hypothetical protein